jgi:hypothetical protein
VSSALPALNCLDFVSPRVSVLVRCMARSSVEISP